MTTFADVPEQPQAKRLLEAALADGPSHAYLFHGPAGVGKRAAARALASALLGDERRVDARTHPDLQVIEALGDMIRIDEIRALHHDLHMRPFEADRRVYLLFDAHRMNDEATAALLRTSRSRLRTRRSSSSLTSSALSPRPSARAASPSPSVVCPAPRSRDGSRSRRPICPVTMSRPSRESPAVGSTARSGCSTRTLARSEPLCSTPLAARISTTASIRATRRQ